MIQRSRILPRKESFWYRKQMTLWGRTTLICNANNEKVDEKNIESSFTCERKQRRHKVCFMANLHFPQYLSHSQGGIAKCRDQS